MLDVFVCNMSSYDYIECSVENGIAEIMLDRPDVLNAFTPDMKEEMADAIREAQDDDDVYVIILSGKGRGFCSGADISGMGGERSRLDAATGLWEVQDVNRQLHDGPKPTIAAVNGPAIGAGCDFALACDLRVMSESATMRQQFVNIGLVPGDGGGWHLPRLIGESKAKEFILTGRDITAEDAEDVGLVIDVVADGETLEAARDLAVEIRDKPAAAVQESKDLIDVTQSYQDYGQAAIEAQWRVRNDPEHGEAVSALREDRDPEFNRDY
jgi:enoyl-CoA hydratase/carnithine racemase